jgi:hypothetical protein
VSRANEPAYPTPWHNDGDLNASAPNGEVVPPQGTILLYGVSLREHFAAMALNSVALDLDQGAPSVAQISLELGIEPSTYSYDPHWEQFVAHRVVRRADALLAALSKPTGSEK